MSDRYSFPFRLIHNMTEAPGTAQAISDDLFTIIRQAAGKVRPGATVAEQINAAWLNMGRPAMWRVKSAWWRDGSSSWSAQAVRDFQQRYQAFLAREAQRIAHEKTLDAIKQRPAEPDYVGVARAEYQDLVSRIAALEAALRLRS